MLLHKGLYDVQHGGKMEIICLRMSDLVKNLRYTAAAVDQRFESLT